MTPEAQRIAIAEACGWVRLPPDIDFGFRWQKGTVLTNWSNKEPSPFPDYLNDLNAMHEAEKALIERHKNAGSSIDAQYYGCWTRYVDNLRNPKFYGASIHATAAQRAEAFLRTLNLWKDE